VKELIIEEEALAEYREAASYYEADNPDVALRFVEQVEGIIENIHREPHLWPLDPTISARLGVRRQRVDGFPYSVVYLETPSAIHVLAVAPGKREPGYWRKRLPPSTR
jgi:plasmid stabilization system protein ParE